MYLLKKALLTSIIEPITFVDFKTYRTSYGLLSYDTTIEGPAFLNIENKKANVKDTGLITLKEPSILL